MASWLTVIWFTDHDGKDHRIQVRDREGTTTSTVRWQYQRKHGNDWVVAWTTDSDGSVGIQDPTDNPYDYGGYDAP